MNVRPAVRRSGGRDGLPALWDAETVDPHVPDLSAALAAQLPPGLPAEHEIGLSDGIAVLAAVGDPARIRDLASVSKPVTALAALIAVERGLLDLDQAVPAHVTPVAAVPAGTTVRHLLAHTAGFPFEGGEAIAEPGTRRIYSNTGFEVLGAVLEESTGHELPDWVEQTVLAPLGLTDLEVDGSPAAGYRGSVRDLLAVGRELLTPTLLGEELHREATRVQFPGLAGILPGYGRQRPNDWGLGFEIRDHKSPHWTGTGSSPATFGHFGQSGSFLWVDPAAGLTAVHLGAERFGPAHVEHWPALTDTLLGLARDAR